MPFSGPTVIHFRFEYNQKIYFNFVTYITNLIIKTPFNLLLKLQVATVEKV